LAFSVRLPNRRELFRDFGEAIFRRDEAATEKKKKKKEGEEKERKR
jgi:hypothetical protein